MQAARQIEKNPFKRDLKAPEDLPIPYWPIRKPLQNLHDYQSTVFWFTGMKVATKGAYGIAWGNEVEMKKMKTVLDQLVREQSTQDSFSKTIRLINHLHTREAEELHETVRKIANDSREMPIGGSGCCTTCSWLFEESSRSS